MSTQKHISIMAILLIAPLAVPLSAKSGVNNKIFVSPAEGGNESAKEYFDYELWDATWLLGYELADMIEKSGYYITVSLQEDDGVNTVTVALYNTGTKEQIAASAMGYTVLTDMDGWNRYLINELMMSANVTRSSTAGGIAVGGTAVDGTVNGRIASGETANGERQNGRTANGRIASGETANGENGTGAAPKFGEGKPPHYWLYLGLQGAYSARFYTDPD
jgi:hypothetical protein